ncbi:hypothetical protein MPSEU_000626900 [Mayamaea pseudoterrestris]|nr:hypothetical protein MPSEU_000626900 [Mayamaea pseudoterrestris]
MEWCLDAMQCAVPSWHDKKGELAETTIEAFSMCRAFIKHGLMECHTFHAVDESKRHYFFKRVIVCAACNALTVTLANEEERNIMEIQKLNLLKVVDSITTSSNMVNNFLLATENLLPSLQDKASDTAGAAAFEMFKMFMQKGLAYHLSLNGKY